MYKRILVPTDGSACSEQGIRHSLRLAKRVGAEMVFLHVIEPLPAALTTATPSAGFPGLGLYVDDYFGDLRQVGRTALDAAAGLARRAGVRSRTELVGPAHPAEAIVSVAEKKRCDLIVMGSHGRSGLTRFVLGSVTEGVLRRTTKALLVVHCTEKPGRKARRRRKA